MKPVKQDAKKLDLQKKTVAVLSSDDQKSVEGGLNEAPITTSWGPCTGFTCCPPATTGQGNDEA
jgi:hypothetical protein